ncbi:hypothetical protein IMZ48_04965 [Candidatus Bathyarchaeota archaeon]|nr:hypothetical protein [Chloroflexota bacterium]MBE3041928.1 hypothetical protein [Candidatus Bathyarchaeota archaeon]MBE3118795.1 hypothetical protein [Candidatus Atribacteria bacterium]
MRQTATGTVVLHGMTATEVNSDPMTLQPAMQTMLNSAIRTSDVIRACTQLLRTKGMMLHIKTNYPRAFLRFMQALQPK